MTHPNHAALVACCPLLLAGCASVLSADAERMIALTTSGATVSLPGQPSGDFAYGVSGRPGSPVTLLYESAGEIAGARSYRLPEILWIYVAGRRPDASTDFNSTSRYYDDIEPTQYWFRSRNFSAGDALQMRASFSMRYLPRPAGPVAATTAITEARPASYNGPSTIAVRAGGAGGAFAPYFEEGFPLMLAEFDDLGDACGKLTLVARAGPGEFFSTSELSFPIDEPLAFTATALLNSVSARVTASGLVETDPDGPRDLWRTACDSDAGAAPVSIEIVSALPRARGGAPQPNVADAILGGAARGWLAVVASPSFSGINAYYPADSEVLRADQFAFARAPGGFILDSVAAAAGPER